MSERTEIARIVIHTDDDTGMYRVGEVDGGFNCDLEKIVRDYGSDGLIRQLSIMIHKVVDTQFNINQTDCLGVAKQDNQTT